MATEADLVRAFRTALVPAGPGRHRAMAEDERIVLTRLAVEENGRWSLGRMAAELFGEGVRPGAAASPLWRLRDAGVLEVSVVDPEAPGGPEAEVKLLRFPAAPGRETNQQRPADQSGPNEGGFVAALTKDRRFNRAKERMRWLNAPTFQLAGLQRTAGTMTIDTPARKAALYELATLLSEVTVDARRVFDDIVRRASLEDLPPVQLLIADEPEDRAASYSPATVNEVARVTVDFRTAVDRPELVEPALIHELTHHLGSVGLLRGEVPAFVGGKRPQRGGPSLRPLRPGGSRALEHGPVFVAAARHLAGPLGQVAPTLENARWWPTGEVGR